MSHSAAPAVAASTPAPFLLISRANEPLSADECQSTLRTLSRFESDPTGRRAVQHMQVLFQLQRCSGLQPGVAAARAKMVEELGFETTRRVVSGCGLEATRKGERDAALVTMRNAEAQRAQLHAALDWSTAIRLHAKDRIERVGAAIRAVGAIFDPTPRF